MIGRAILKEQGQLCAIKLYCFFTALMLIKYLGELPAHIGPALTSLVAHECGEHMGASGWRWLNGLVANGHVFLHMMSLEHGNYATAFLT
jgi:hypothetical protein